MKFRKKPVVIEAMKFDGTKETFDAIWDWMKGDDSDSPMLGHDGPTESPTGFGIKTLEGTMRCKIGDWVVKGVKGEFYPCKPDIFEATYEEVA